MALSCSSPAVILPRGQNKKAMPRACMLPNSQTQPSRASTPSSYKSFTANNKVFEDQATGVVCYVDGKGEVICEGYDEGPRFSPWTSEGADQQRNRDNHIPNFQPMKTQISQDDDFHQIICKQN